MSLPYTKLFHRHFIPSSPSIEAYHLRTTSSLKSNKLSAPPKKPLSSEVLTQHLRQNNLPHWTAFCFYQHKVINDQFGASHFNWEVDGRNYHVLRTGCFPFIKYHCSSRPYADLEGEDKLYTLLKVVNFGIPTLAYGVISWLLVRHSQDVVMPDGTKVKVFFWYKEIPGALH